MKNISYTATIEVAKPPQVIFNCLKEVPKWWSKDFEGKSSELNDEFIIHHPNAHFSKQKLIEVVPDKKIVWLVIDSTLYWMEKNKHEWTNTKMIFDINTAGDKTTLRFIHDGLLPEKESYERCSQGWNMVIKEWLLNYINKSKEKIKDCEYSTSIEVPFPPRVVFEHINDVFNWWPEEFEGQSAKLNDEFTFRSGSMHYSKQKVVEFLPNERVVWLVTESMRKPDNYEWTGTKMTFELIPNGDKTLLNFTYNGPVPENENDRLVQVCDMVIKEKFYNYITEGKKKEII